MKHKKGKVKKQGEQYVVQDLETGNILPLKFSQIQSAIDNGEVDSDKEVEFEIKDGFVHGGEGVITDRFSIRYAKIIPQKKRMYSEEEILMLLDWLGPNSYHNANTLQPHVNSVRSGGKEKLLELFNQRQL